MASRPIIIKKQIKKMNLKNSILFFIFFWFPVLLNAQNNLSDKLDFASFMQIVKANHPVAKQAVLLESTAKANQLAAKGNFDPKLFYDFQNKYFDSKNYYRLSNGGFQIPTWYGLDFKMGYEINAGQNIDPQNITAANGIPYAQISLPVLQGLLIDDRRATLRKAALFQNQSVFEKATIINELLYQAGKSYWEWQLAYANAKVFENAVSIARQRFEAIKRSAELGDRPAIDTVESFIQLQERQLSLQQANLEYQSRTFVLSNYLWMDNNTPVEITSTTTPVTYSIVSNLSTDLTELSVMKVDSLINSHPELKVYQIKLDQYQIDRQLKKDKLKPKLNFNYNPLGDLANNNWLSLNNYKWGVSFGFPIFLRKERGELKMAAIKIENTKNEAANKKNSLINKVKAKQIEFQSLLNQYALYQTTVKSYEQLWLAEKKLFDRGESSLFMINNREMGYVNAQLKLNEIFTKNKNVSLELIYSCGQLVNLNF